MGFFSSNRARTPKKSSKPPKEEPKEGFFGKKGLSRSELIHKLKKDPGKIPGTARWYSRKQRKGLEKKFDFQRYGSTINRQDAKDLIRGLEKERIGKKPWDKKRQEIDDLLSYLKGKLSNK